MGANYEEVGDDAANRLINCVSIVKGIYINLPDSTVIFCCAVYYDAVMHETFASSAKIGRVRDLQFCTSSSG